MSLMRKVARFSALVLGGPLVASCDTAPADVRR